MTKEELKDACNEAYYKARAKGNDFFSIGFDEGVKYALEYKQPTMKHIKVRFIAIHHLTREEIIFDQIGMNQELSLLTFASAKHEGFYALPSEGGDDTTDQYHIYLEIDGERMYVTPEGA